MIRGHRILYSSPRTPANIYAEFKKEAPFAPGWHFGEARYCMQRRLFGVVTVKMREALLLSTFA